MNRIFFATPGELTTQSGGYSYDRRLILELNSQGRNVAHLQLGASYPKPTNSDAENTASALAALPSDSVVIIDGLALGAIQAEVVTALKAQLVALIHHPLAFEGGLDPARRKLLFDLERRNLRHAKRIIVPSPHIAKLLTTDYAVRAEHITVARPGIDRPPEPGSLIDPPLILSVGIQVPRKGHDVLLGALSKIKQLRWQAVIAGPPLDAEYAAFLKGLTKELGLVGRVTFAGQVSDAKLSELYRSATIFALATRFEGYGMVFGEAMAHRLPIVSCDVGAVSETISPAAARLVQPDDPEAFAYVLAELLENRPLREALASAAFEASADLTSWKDSASLVGEMLDSLSAGND